ncbi:extracellular solute-binding protein [Kribbella sp. NPDC051770]|uniref:extracellular solute-binding protein n=1 Tax=Kribbella sp. NPDC051770 TaxID=3155413 RepID=UPI00342A6723
MRPRQLLIRAAALSGVAALAACSSSTTPDTAARDASGAVQVSLWHSASGAAAETLAQLVDQFNAGHQGKIAVTASFQGSYADAQTKYTAAVQSGKTPSIMMMNDVSTQFMIDSQQTVPVSTFTGADKSFDAATIPTPVKSYYSDADGNLLSMPFNASQPIVYVNNALITKAGLDPSRVPTTWSGLAAWAKQIKARTGAHGLAMTLTDSWMIEELSATAGVEFCTPRNGRSSDRATAVSLSDPKQLALLGQLQDLYTSGAAFNAGAGSSALNNAFASGKVAMMMASTGAFGTIKKDSSFPLTVAAFPKVSDTADAGVVVGGASLWIDAVGHSKDEQQASYEVLKYLQSASVQARWAQATGFLSVNTGSAELPEGKALLAQPAFAAMYKQLAETPANTVTAGCRMGPYTAVRGAVISNVNKLLAADQTPAQTAQASQEAAASILADYAKRIQK